MNALVAQDKLEKMIFVVRDTKVMVDRDKAELYGVQGSALNQAVKRNTKRFPDDFMFQLRESEKSQLVTICDRLTSWKHAKKNRIYSEEKPAIDGMSSALGATEGGGGTK